jgi:hypothetical protein
MLREVTLTFENTQKTYEKDTNTHYEARVEAIKDFLEEFKIPGKPTDYIVGRFKGLIGVTVRSAVDRRTLPKTNEPSRTYVYEQVTRLRQYVRTSTFLTDKSKSKATKLLLQLEEVLSG